MRWTWVLLGLAGALVLLALGVRMGTDYTNSLYYH